MLKKSYGRLFLRRGGSADCYLGQGQVTKPTANQLPPIALTDTSYKIFTGLIKSEIEAHLKTNDLLMDYNQASPTKR